MASASNTGAYSKPEEFEERDAPERKWYDSEIGNRLTDASKNFYEEYTGLKGDELIAHLHQSRDLAWAISPWPYVGQWGFLSTRIGSQPGFNDLLDTVKSGGCILDLGCGLGQALRYLAYRGAPTDNMYASDLVGDFWNVGYTLFRDKDRFHAKFFQANALDAENALLAEGNGLKGTMDAVWMGNFLHAFNAEEQIKALATVNELCKVGATVYGTQWGVDWSLASEELKKDKRAQGMNDDKSLMKQWDKLAETTGSKWVVEASMRPLSEDLSNERDHAWMPKGAVRVMFVAKKEA